MINFHGHFLLIYKEKKEQRKEHVSEGCRKNLRVTFIYIAEGVQRAINPQHHENLNWPNQSHQKQMSLYELQVHKTKLGDKKKQ